jgi:hypothetical protein
MRSTTPTDGGSRAGSRCDFTCSRALRRTGCRMCLSQRGLVMVVLLATVGCEPDAVQGPGGGSKKTSCRDYARTPIGASEVTDVGSALQLSHDVATERQVHGLIYPRMSDMSSSVQQSMIVSAIADEASARAIDRTGTSGGEVDCGIALEMDASIDFVTADGSFSDEFQGTVRRESANGITSVQGALPSSMHEGTFDLQRVSSDDSATLSFFTTVQDVPSGRLTLDSQPTSSNSQGVFTIAEWPDSDAD